MNKEPKILPQAIKIIVDIYGKNVVKDVQMVNIMNDVVSLEDPNSVKSILRGVIKLGYGGKVLAINTSKDDYHLKVKTFSKDISNSLGYKEVIVQYILYSIAFGIGICPQEPYLKNLEAPKREQRSIEPSSAEDERDDEITVPYKTIATVIAIIIMIGGIVGYNYWRFSEARVLFSNRMLSGDSFMNNGDYVKAVDSYKEAFNGYNDINSGSYKKNAVEKIDDVVDKLIREGESDNKSLLKAYQVIESELQLDLDANVKDRLTTKKNELENTIKERTDNGRNNLIMNISSNNGKLDELGKKHLMELLELTPNDYWLNFIKNKSYE